MHEPRLSYFFRSCKIYLSIYDNHKLVNYTRVMDKPKIIKSELFQVLSIKSFQLLWSSQVITQTAYNMLLFILGVIIYQKTRSNAQVSLFYLTVGIPAFVFGII